MKVSSAISSRSNLRAEPARSADSSSSTAERFTLDGPSLKLDPRVHAYRADIADIALAGQLFAPHYARPMMRLVGSEVASLLDAPSAGGPVLATIQPGGEFAVLEIAGQWAWGYTRRDHLVGYVRLELLSGTNE